MKSKQFCSVCKQWLEMEVAPTGEDDDGVIWFRCPQCQGYLPKLGGDLAPQSPAAAEESEEARDAPAGESSRASVSADDLPWDSPADMMAARDAGQATDDVLAGRAEEADGDAVAEPDGAEEAKDGAGAAAEPEPVAEYAAQLAAADPAAAVPYRPWESYEVGQCIHHLAWDDCGVVVAKEVLPGGRRVVKCYFASVGVVRLIEGASR